MMVNKSPRSNTLILPTETRGKGKTCRQAKDADGKFCLGKRCQRQPSANHICVPKRLIDD